MSVVGYETNEQAVDEIDWIGKFLCYDCIKVNGASINCGLPEKNKCPKCGRPDVTTYEVLRWS